MVIINNTRFANENEIRSWLIDGNSKRAKYCVIILDSWDNECVYDYPVYAMSDEDVEKIKARNFGPCTSIVEVFDLSINIEKLINDRKQTKVLDSSKLLEKAIELALNSHRNQKDKGGKPYILHPLRVMLKMENINEMIAAVLHDVVEDSECSLAELKEIGYSDDLLSTLDSLTKKTDELYEDFISRVMENELAIKVKIADIEDNMDIKRIPEPCEADYLRLEKYRKAYSILIKQRRFNDIEH